MQSCINVEITLFGSFRKFDNGTPVILNLPQGTNLNTIRNGLLAELTKRYPDFNQQSLIDESALADEKQILDDSYIINQDVRLAILPPVCGG